MKFNWDKNYLKISFYVVLTLVCAYILFKVVDSAAFILTNADVIISEASNALGYVVSVFSVLITAFVIAYILDPLVDFFQTLYEKYFKDKPNAFFSRISRIKFIKKRTSKNKPSFKKRTAGTSLTYLMFALIISLLILFLVSKIGGKSGSGFSQGIMEVVNSMLNELSDFYTNAQLTLEEWGATQYLSDAITGFVNGATGFVKSFSKDIIGTITSTGSSIIGFLMSLVVAFYFLKDKHAILYRMNDIMETFLSSKWLRRIRNIGGDIHAVFSGYIRGQLTDAIIMGTLLSIGLSLVGIDLAVIIGIFSGFANLIPYFGALVGFLLSVLIALLAGDVTKAIFAGLVVIILQQIDGVFIVPKVVGEKVELSPVLVLLSLSVFGSVFGIVGMIFAVPVCAIIKIFLVRFTRRYKRNKLEKAREARFNEQL